MVRGRCPVVQGYSSLVPILSREHQKTVTDIEALASCDLARWDVGLRFPVAVD